MRSARDAVVGRLQHDECVECMTVGWPSSRHAVSCPGRPRAGGAWCRASAVRGLRRWGTQAWGSVESVNGHRVLPNVGGRERGRFRLGCTFPRENRYLAWTRDQRKCVRARDLVVRCALRDAPGRTAARDATPSMDARPSSARDLEGRDRRSHLPRCRGLALAFVDLARSARLEQTTTHVDCTRSAPASHSGMRTPPMSPKQSRALRRVGDGCDPAKARLLRCGAQASRPRAMSWERSRILTTCDRALPARVAGRRWITRLLQSPRFGYRSSLNGIAADLGADPAARRAAPSPIGSVRTGSPARSGRTGGWLMSE